MGRSVGAWVGRWAAYENDLLAHHVSSSAATAKSNEKIDGPSLLRFSNKRRWRALGKSINGIASWVPTYSASQQNALVKTAVSLDHQPF